MQIAHFDKLKELVKESTEKIYRLKYENNNLKKENQSLKEKLDKINIYDSPNEITENFKKLENENRELKAKHELVASRLVKLLDRVKSLAGGVES
jgi:FtsZ-binding cell division protein ZapB